MSNNNPLLDFSDFPRFDQINPGHVEPALDQLLNKGRNLVRQLIEQIDHPDWENFMAPLEQLDDELERMWSPVSHLNSVADSKELRAAYEACLPKLSEYATEMGQNSDLFNKITEIESDSQFASLDLARKKVIKNDLRDFRLSGVDLPEEKKKRFGEINQKLSELANRFSQNLLDATDAWTLDVEDESKLQGLPQNALALAKKTAEEAGIEGWRFTLQGPSYIPFISYCGDRELREKIYSAYVTRASETGPKAGEFDNGPLIDEILELRDEKAKILGFEHYAAYSLETKMAQDAVEVENFLMQLAEKSLPVARQEWQELQDFAREECGLSNLQAWDIAWVSEKLKQHLFSFSDEDLRPYFPLPKVLDGMFRIVHNLFGVNIEPLDKSDNDHPPVWNDDVMVFEITDNEVGTRGYFYVDLFARGNKRGGAWMADCVNRRRHTQGIQLPVAFLTCNFSSPVGDRPSLLSHDEVMTMFHEFGHGLHHMLTRIEVAGVSGINGVPWDAVELPSQFLENWCWEKEALDLISGHVETGDPLPADLLQKMKSARNFQSAMQMVRQIEFSLFDLNLHAGYRQDSGISVQDVLNNVRERVAVVIPPGFNRFQNSFGHIFAGGYAAGYYSYKWSEVLSADAFSLFEERGIFDRATGKSFLEHILEPGGSEEPMTLFTRFRGRKPEVSALLRHSGLLPSEQAA